MYQWPIKESWKTHNTTEKSKIHIFWQLALDYIYLKKYRIRNIIPVLYLYMCIYLCSYTHSHLHANHIVLFWAFASDFFNYEGYIFCLSFKHSS